MALSDEQARFLEHDPRRHARMLAGPGTGKSYTCVAYLEHLARKLPDLRAQMVTFTRAATAEFAEKMGDAELTGLGVSLPRTVHSFALRLLMAMKAPGLPLPLRIPDRWESKNLVRPHLSRRLKALGHTEATPTMVNDLEAEMAAGWESLDPETELIADVNPQLRNAYLGMWKQHRMIFGYVLVSELPYRAGDAIADLGLEAVKLDLLLVDEYQDLNEADVRLIRALSERVAVVAIGDDDQSIYRFRHAAPQGIRRFLDEFSTSNDFALTLSRRCGSRILEAATMLIETAPDRPARPRLRTLPEASEGDFAYLRFASGPAEAKGAARIIAARIASGVPASKVAALVRSQVDVWAGLLRPALEARGLTLSSTDWVDLALSDSVLRRAIALARLALVGDDSLAWWSLVHTTPQVGPAFVDYVYDRVDRGERFGQTLLRLHEQGYPDQRPATANRVGAVIRDVLDRLQRLEVEKAALDERGWGGWLIDQLEGEDLSEEGRRLLDTVGRVVPPGEGLDGFLSQLEPLGRDLAANEAESVRLMTITQSKGLTLNTAVVMGVEEGLIPMPPPKGDPDEERRLLYVAMTRATDMCVLTWARQRIGQVARMGTPRVGGPRRRSPLLEGLEIGNWVDGPTWVSRLEAG